MRGFTFLLLGLSACCNSGPERPAPSNSPEAPTTATATAPTAPAAAATGPDGMPLNIPTARTPAPSANDWTAATALRIPTARPLGCEVNMIREWVRVNCGKRRSGGTPTAVQVRGGCSQDTYTSMRANANLVTGLSSGHRCEVEFTWTDGKELFVVDWPRGKRPTLSFEPTAADNAAPSASARIPIRPLRIPNPR